MQAHASGDVFRFPVHSESGELWCLLVRDCPSTGFDIQNQCFTSPAALAGYDDHIVNAAQIAFPDPLLVDQLIRHFEMVERIPNPAYILRAAPGREDRGAR